MEIIALFSLHSAIQYISAVEVLSGAKAQGEDVLLCHLVDQLLGNHRAVREEERKSVDVPRSSKCEGINVHLPVVLFLSRLWGNMRIDKFPQRLLQPPVAILVVRARRLGLQPQRFGIRHSA